MSHALTLAQTAPRQRVQTARVTRCEAVPSDAPVRGDANLGLAQKGKKGKKGKKKKKEGDEPLGELFEVELEQSLLFPEGGGQPSDRGTIGALQVEYVFRREADGAVVHLARGQAGDAPAAGDEVEVVLDWARRHDHMQQHSAQHLISALALRLHGWRTASWWLAAAGDCHIEFETDAAGDAELRELEDAVNEAIRGAAEVRAVTGRDAAGLLAGAGELARGAAAADAAGDGAGVDESFRVVSIAGHDANACCGTHVASTAELQLVKLTGAQAARGRAKVFFTAGARLGAAWDEMHAAQQALTKMLSGGPAEHAALVRRALDDARAAAKSAKRAWAEVADADAARLAAGDEPAVSLLRLDPRYPVGAAADALAGPLVAAGRVALLAAAAPQGGPGQFVVLGPEDRVAALGPAVCEALGGRGGGRKGKFQGKAPALTEAAFARAAELLVASEHPAQSGDSDLGAALFAASGQSDSKAVRALLDQGADVEWRGPGGCTPLFAAVASLDAGVVRTLLECGASVTARDAKGRSLMAAAAVKVGSGPVTKLLLEWDAPWEPAIAKTCLDAMSEVDLGYGNDGNWGYAGYYMTAYGTYEEYGLVRSTSPSLMDRRAALEAAASAAGLVPDVAALCGCFLSMHGRRRRRL